ncbi:u-box domain-containing protein 12 [Quercus suber]|uniref:RING-type E3 ubiquitin transferase n=1 Tax=Quercus suber TaxID=58331 RepID=A0AAW0KMU9_QUESU
MLYKCYYFQVEASLEYFEELITMFDAPDLKLLSCVYNQSNDVATDDRSLSKLCTKLHFYGVEDIKRESQVLKKVMDMKKVMNIPRDGNLEESENKMSVLLEKLENFLESQTVPNDFRCPISHELMRDPVITCTGQTYERASIETWLNEENRNCPVTGETLYRTSLTSNRALQSFISKWDRINGMEPFNKFGNSLSKRTFNHMEQVFGRGETERQQPHNCQKSAKLMKDPVIICTGETFERASIEKWLKAGHTTCPLTVEFLSSTSLTPNHALYSLISNWREVNGLKPFERSISSDQGMVVSTDDAEGAELESLLSKLTSDKSEDRRSAAGETRELCYLDENSCKRLIPQLVGLLSSPDNDTNTKNYAIAVLRQLSFRGRDRLCIIFYNPGPGILHVLENGSMEARGDAALTFWSLLTLNDLSKKTRSQIRQKLGASKAIPALVNLLRDGGPREKTASARALSVLCKYEGKKGLAISAGVVSMLLGELREYSRSLEDELVSGRPPPYGPICDKALDVMKLLVSHPDGKVAIRDCEPVPVLLLLLIIGSPRNKEIVLAILSQMQSHLALDVPHLPQAKELKQILLDLNRDDDITSDEAERDLNTLLFPFIPGIVYVLKNGSMKAREGAALTFWSLQTLNDESRKTFGESGAIPALVKLLRDGGPRQKTASARALSKLCKYKGNQGLAISAGVVSMLIGELRKYSRSRKNRLVSGRPPPYGPICDEALDVMKLLVSHPAGKAAIRGWRPVPVLLLLLIIGPPRNKEIVLAILSQMQSDLDLNDWHLPQAEELRQILMDLKRDDDITSDEAERGFKTLLSPFILGIVDVLENGSMEARGGAALTFWSLLTLNDESRETLAKSRAIPALEKLLRDGGPRAIPALEKLLRDGGPREKTASTRALSELCK